MNSQTSFFETHQILKQPKFHSRGPEVENSHDQILRHFWLEEGDRQQYYLQGQLINKQVSKQKLMPRELFKQQKISQKYKKEKKIHAPENNKKEIQIKHTKNRQFQQSQKFQSPKKTVKKFQISQQIQKHFCFKPQKLFFENHDQKELIVKNIFYRNDRYYYSDQIVFSEILKRIYYQNYKIEDIKDYILPCFKKISNYKEFFKVLIREAHFFGNYVKKFLSSKIEKLSKNQIENESTENQFKDFSSNIKRYIKTIDCLHSHYKHLESINFEIEKLTKIYLENFVKNQDQLTGKELKYHRRLFINCVYNDSLIRDFIISFYELFEQKSFFSNYHQKAFQQVEEIYENLEISFAQSSTQSTEAPVNNNQISNECNSENLSDEAQIETTKNWDGEDNEEQELTIEQLKEIQKERKKQKLREKRKKRKAKKQQKLQEQKLIEYQLLDQMIAEKLPKKLKAIDQIFQDQSFQKIQISFDKSEKSNFNPLIKLF